MEHSLMALEASDDIPPLAKKSSIMTKCIIEQNFIQVIKSNTQRLAEDKVEKLWQEGFWPGKEWAQAPPSVWKPSELTCSVREIHQWEQRGGERQSGGPEGRTPVSPVLGGKTEVLVSNFALKVLETCNENEKRCARTGYPCQMVTGGVMRRACTLQWWRTSENGGRAKCREKLEEVKYTTASQLWLHVSPLMNSGIGFQQSWLLLRVIMLSGK